MDDEEFRVRMRANVASRERLGEVMAQIRPLAIADGRRVMEVARERAAEWGLDPDQIGIMGLSAGGVVTAGVALERDAASRPAFAAPIYGVL